MLSANAATQRNPAFRTSVVTHMEPETSIAKMTIWPMQLLHPSGVPGEVVAFFPALDAFVQVHALYLPNLI